MKRKVKDRTGEISVNTQGLKMKVKLYRNAKDMDIEFENGIIRSGVSYANFKKGNVFGESDYDKFKDAKDRIDKDMLIRLIDQGFNQRECAEKIGVGRDTLSRWMKNNNINHEFTRHKNIKGKKFGRLSVIKENGLNKYDKMTWLCKCDCGNKKIVLGTELINGNVRSCGCLLSETRIKNNIARGNLNGASSSDNPSIRRLASIYSGMKNRCLNTNEADYKHYGGRGIEICENWLDEKYGFDNFYNWAIENGYSNELTIDRIDVDGNYEPNNCRWATRKEQGINKRDSIYLTFEGETKHISEWAEMYGVSTGTLRGRYYKNKDVDYIFYPKKHRHTYIEINGVEKTISEWAKISGVNEKTIYQRYKKLKWSGEKLLSKSEKTGGKNE